MPEHGLTDAGFVRKRLDESVADLNAGMQEIYGSGVGLDPDSPNGQLVGLIAGAADEVWEAIEEVTTALDPQSARGILLSRLVQLNGLTRRDGTKSTMGAVLTGTAFTAIPDGTLIKNDQDEQFECVGGTSIGALGSGVGVFRAVDVGPKAVDDGTPFSIVTLISGWTGVAILAGSGVPGSIDETDPVLRRRREASTEAGAVSILDALVAVVRALDGVLDVRVVENKTISTDGLGVPGKSFMVVVDGGADQEVADSIWAKHPMGIASYGAESETVVDSEGVSQPVYFQRPADVDIYVSMTIATTSDFPADGDEQIKQAIVDFANGDLEGYESSRFGIGDDVLYSRLYTAINSVPGHTVTALTIGTAPAPVGTANIAISDAQAARFDTANIVVST